MNDISLSHIGVIYRSKKTEDRVALSDFSLEANNEIIAILGPNGSGKSTLLHVIAQTVIPVSGKVAAPTSRERLAVVFQTPALDELLTVRENLMVAGGLHNLSKAETRLRIESICSDLDIGDRLDDQVRHLSGGLARRADLARALITHPAVLLLDEPTTGLDIDARRIFWDTLSRARSQWKMTVMLATHFTDEAEQTDRVLLMKEGHLAHQGSPAELRSHLGEQIIRVSLQSEIDTQRTSDWLTKESIEHVTSRNMILGIQAIPGLIERCPVRTASVTIAPPTLDDVYTYHAQSEITDLTSSPSPQGSIR